MARAKNTSDVQETETFLESKIQKGTSLLHHRNDGKVTGWHGLMLDDQAKSEVEKYEGIESIMREGKLVAFRALPDGDQSCDPYEAHGTLSRRALLSQRDGKWEKQTNADEALRMDSQYK
jgi:hypothetical protein